LLVVSEIVQNNFSKKRAQINYSTIRYALNHSFKTRPDLAGRSRAGTGSGLKKIEEVKTRGDPAG